MDKKELAPRLRKAMDERDLQGGYLLLKKFVPELAKTKLSTPDDIPLLYELSRWLTTWPDLENIISPAANAAAVIDRLSLHDFALLRLAKAFIALAHRDLDAVDESVTPLLSLQKEIDPYLIAGAHFCRGRVLRLKSSYKEALDEVLRSSELLKQNAPHLAAVTDLQAQWLQLQLGNIKQAAQTLNEAERTLSATGDLFNQAYVNYLRGRALRFSGNYREAANAFQRSYQLYLKDAALRGGHPHRTAVRVLANHARAIRLLARQMPAETQALRQESGSMLDEAVKLADELGVNLGERARIKIERAYLALDSNARRTAGDLISQLDKECAAMLDDHIMWARIHLLQFRHLYSYIVRHKDDRLDPSDRNKPAKALEYAQKAVKHAEDTEHRRLKARGYIAEGLARLMTTDSNRSQELYVRAESQLTDEDQDSVRDELNELAKSISGSETTTRPVIQYFLSDLFGKNVEEFVKSTFKPDVIRATYDKYGSEREMRRLTGLAAKTIQDARKKRA